MRRRHYLLTLFLISLSEACLASQGPVDSARFEAEVRQLELSIIAPCCWHQPVATHNSPIALQIRQEIRESLAQGKTPDQIKAEYVRKYGERILAVPPRNAFNQFLWIIPIAASVGAFGVAGHFLRLWRKAQVSKPEVRTRKVPDSAAFAKVDEQLKKWDE